MSAKTSIEWTDYSWNPVSGCDKVSPGCDHCYAETIATRFAGSDLYDDELYPDWHRVEIAAFTGNAVAGQGERTEVLWSNRPLSRHVQQDLLTEVGA